MRRLAVYAIFLWHGFFLALTLSMINFNTVLPSLVSELTNSKIVFGFLYSILLAAPYLFNVIFGHIVSSHRYRRKFLLLGIYLRSVAFLGMALFVHYFAIGAPRLVVGSLFLWLLLFALSGGLAGLVYSDIVGKLIPTGERGKLYATKQFVAGIASLSGGVIVAKIFSVSSLGFPANYALILSIGFVGLAVASVAFWFIEEPPSSVCEKREALTTLAKRVPAILRQNAEFRRFVIVENLSGFSLMLLPFYMIFAKEVFGVDESYIGPYLLIQTVGILLSNVLWGMISVRWSSRAVVRVCILVGGLLPMAALFLSQFGPHGFLPVFLLVGFVYSGRLVGFEPYLLDIIPDMERPIYLGIRGTLDIFIAFLPPLGGLFIDLFGYAPIFVLVTIVMLFAFFLLGKTELLWPFDGRHQEQ